MHPTDFQLTAGALVALAAFAIIACLWIAHSFFGRDPAVSKPRPHIRLPAPSTSDAYDVDVDELGPAPFDGVVAAIPTPEPVPAPIFCADCGQRITKNAHRFQGTSYHGACLLRGLDGDEPKRNA